METSTLSSHLHMIETASATPTEAAASDNEERGLPHKLKLSV
jgi:hypothetical protein